MLIKQRDLFWGMDSEFVKKATDQAVHLSCKDGEKLFSTGDKADRFHILLKGKVSIIWEVDGKEHHSAHDPGEIALAEWNSRHSGLLPNRVNTSLWNQAAASWPDRG